MELYDVMRTTFSAREFTDEPLPDDVLVRILDNARFAPSGGNRQGWRVIVVRDRATKAALSQLTVPAAKRYTAQSRAGETPFGTVVPSQVSDETIAATAPLPGLIDSVRAAPVVLVVCVDLERVASVDATLPRVGIVTGASVYPFAWNILLAARNEGYGGTLTTLAILSEAGIRELLGIPEHVAVCAIMPIGRPAKQLTKLRREPVSAFAMRERWSGEPID